MATIEKLSILKTSIFANQIALVDFSYHVAEAMKTFMILILILKINILKCFKAEDNGNLKDAAPITWGEFDIFPVLNEISDKN